MVVFSVLLIGYISIVVLTNRFQFPSEREVYFESAEQGQFQNSFEIVSWNLGYAGLGSDANFVADGGKNLLPRSRRHVINNRRGIQQSIQDIEADIYLFQEVAGPSFINRNVDLKGTLEKIFLEATFVYSPETRTRLIPFPFRMDVGKATISRDIPRRSEGVHLPLEDVYYAGIVRRHYRTLISRFDLSHAVDPKQLVVFNIHLAAFDDGNTRIAQLEKVIALAEVEFMKGNFVIIGGDWNMRLVATEFPHSTNDEFLFWIADFPHELLPENWQVAASDAVPTVRTLHQAYRKGDNYVAVVDGFIVSPNVQIEAVTNIDLDFKNSDHQPVKMKVILNCESKY